MPDYVIAIDAIGPCWIQLDTEGNPGRTTQLKHATQFATENEARENLEATRRQYPRRKYQVIDISHYDRS